MSINMSIPGMNPAALCTMNPMSEMTSAAGSALSAGGAGIMQSLSQLLGSLSQLLGMGAQGGQFQASPFGQNLGNSLGQMPAMGNQPFNMGQNFDSGFGQMPAMGNQGYNMGNQMPAMGNQGYNMGNQAFNMGQPAQLGNNFGQFQQPQVGAGQCAGQVSQPAMSTGDAAQVLDRNFDRLSNGKETFNANDLSRVANDPNSPPELRQAAQTALSNPSMMNSLDNADARAEGRGQNLDGNVSRGDLAAASSYVPQQPMNAERAAQTLNQNFDTFSNGNQTVTTEDLSRVANDPGQSQQNRAAAQFLLSNPSAFNSLDNADARSQGQSQALDGRISKGDANAGSVQSDPFSQNFGQMPTMGNQGYNMGQGVQAGNSFGQYPQQAMGTAQAAQVLNRDFDKVSNGNETFTASDLARVANDPSSPPDLRQAAQVALSNPSMMNSLDTADARADGRGQNLDGRVSRGDLNAASSYMP